MTEREALEAILERWEDEWEALHPTDPDDPECIPWVTRNEAEVSTERLGALGAWCRISVSHTSSQQMTSGIADRRWDRRGNVIVQLFAPIDSGVGSLADMAEDARVVLEGLRLVDLLIWAGRTEELPEDGAWAMSVVVFPFRYVGTR